MIPIDFLIFKFTIIIVLNNVKCYPVSYIVTPPRRLKGTRDTSGIFYFSTIVLIEKDVPIKM